MTALKRLAAAYMLLLAAVVAVHFLVNQFYDPMSEGRSTRLRPGGSVIGATGTG